MIENNELKIDRHTVVVVDEASTVGTPNLTKLLSCATVGRAKMVLVGDAYQLSPVLARGGMFGHLCADLPWSQRLSEVWRMRNAEERDASLALRFGHGNRLRKAVGWYRTHARLHTGDPIAMASDAVDAYLADRAAGKDSLLVCDTWEMAERSQPAPTRHPHRRRAVIHVRGKGGKDRRIPIEPVMVQVLERYLDTRAARLPAAAKRRSSPGGGLTGWPTTAPLFVGADGERITRGTLQYRVLRAFRRARHRRRPRPRRTRARAAPHLRHRAGQRRRQRLHADETARPLCG
jgi:hypothetical protein